jgi:bifunctional NMN adenylyltransferase/nudix hydrolase
MKKTRYCVYIGRFQPFTSAHLQTVQLALEEAEQLILIVGSAQSPVNLRNIFSYEERLEIIQSALEEAGLAERVIIHGIPDSAYNFNAWTLRVQEIVHQVSGGDQDIAIIGHFKDDSSYYLSHFPHWKLIKLPELQEGLSATEIRSSIYLGNTHWQEHFANMPQAQAKIQELLDQEKDRVQNLREEYHFIQNYRNRWEEAPFPPVFVTTDTAVFCMGHVLLIRRKLNPGKGLLAMPGGFLGQREAILDGALRELKEETKIDIPYPVLRSSISNQKVFDHPDRDPRGRMITHAYMIELQNQKALPKIKAADDAKEAFWLPIARIEGLSREFFGDHQMIIKYFLGRSM